MKKSNVINLNRERRVLFTHTDLDGVGCAVIYAKCFPQVEVYFVDYNEVNETIMDFIVKNHQDMPHIMITDMSVNDDVATLLNETGKVDLVDHHGTAKWLMDKYPWAYVSTDNCATKLLYDILSQTHHIEDYEPFVELVDNYDTWGHGTQPTEQAKDLSRLLYIIGKERFYKRFVLQATTHLSDVEESFLQIDKEKESQYINESIALCNILEDAQGYTYALLAADQYVSNVGHAVLQHYPDIEYVIMLDFRNEKASLRGRGNVDLGVMCKQIGGGGHKKAAGFPMSQSAVKLFLSCDPETCPHINNLLQQMELMIGGEINETPSTEQIQ